MDKTILWIICIVSEVAAAWVFAEEMLARGGEINVWRAILYGVFMGVFGAACYFCGKASNDN